MPASAGRGDSVGAFVTMKADAPNRELSERATSQATGPNATFYVAARIMQRRCLSMDSCAREVASVVSSRVSRT